MTKAKKTLQDSLLDVQKRMSVRLDRYRKALDKDPELIHDEDFCVQIARDIDALNREETKLSQMLELYTNNYEPQGEEVMAEKSMMGSLKSTMVKAAKQGIASATLRSIGDEAVAALGENCPPLIQALPPEIRDTVLCGIVYMLAEACPNVPMAGDVKSVSLVALEGQLSRVFADASTTLMPKLLPLFKSIAALKAADGVAGFVTEGKE